MNYNPFNSNVNPSQNYGFTVIINSNNSKNNNNVKLSTITPVGQVSTISLSKLSEIGNQLNANKKYSYTITAFWPNEPL